MMMHCLGLGGLELAYDESRDKALRAEQPHNKNPYFYELEPPKGIWMSLSEYKGRCVKMMGATCLNRGAAPMKVVFMSRDAKAQHESMRDACGLMQGAYEARMSRYLSAIQSSDEVDSCLVLDYDAVLSNPVKAFRLLKRIGWPIDPEKAAQGVDRSLKHF